MNVSDSERIASFLEAQKIKPTKEIAKADVIIFNTCGVRQMAEDRVFGQIHNIRKKEKGSKKQEARKIIILTGCLANRKDVQEKLKDKVDLFCEIKDFQKEFKNFLIKNSLKIPAQQKNTLCRNYLSINPKYTNSHSAFVPVMTGCNNFCAYCVVPYARGREVSRPVKEIFSEIQKLSRNDCEEITLLGQNVNSYNHNIKQLEIENLKLIKNYKLKIKNSNIINFPILLNLLATTFPKINFKFLTSHPKDFSQDLMKVIAKNKNISHEIHLPIQSGSDKILRAMNRPYTQKHYLNLIKKAQEIIPDVSFTTDIIVGFPGETKKDFTDSIKVFKKVKFNEAYINKYSPRPGTASFSLGDPISWDEKKRREKVLRELIK
jgi:tRNA-2-methylthio-N6-dimethylallyladenosine synthase